MSVPKSPHHENMKYGYLSFLLEERICHKSHIHRTSSLHEQRKNAEILRLSWFRKKMSQISNSKGFFPPWTKQNNKITTTRIYQNKNGRWAFFMSWETKRKVDMLENLYVCKHVTDHMIFETNIFLLSVPYIAIWNVNNQLIYNT